jgi:glycosyltransferase involved in cell wall biosynthesis
MQSKQKIAIFTGAFSSGGAEKQSLLLAKILKDYNYNVIIISYYGERELRRMIEFLESELINYHQLKGNLFIKVFMFYKLIDKLKPEIIINYLPSNNLIGGAIGKICGVKTILGSIRTSRLKYHQYLELLFSHTFLNKYTIINNKCGIGIFTKLGFRSSKIIYIPNAIYPIPQKISRRAKFSTSEEISILMVSRFEKLKDYPTALLSFKSLYSESDLKAKVKMKIIGIGRELNHIKDLISEHKLDKQVELFINPEDIYDHYAAADIFLQTSLYEGASNSILEAMSFSLPIVATRVGDNSEMVFEGQNGILTQVKDTEAISHALKRLITNERLRLSMGSRSYEIAKNKFSIEEFSNNYLNLLRNIDD